MKLKERKSESQSQLCRLSTLATIGRFPNIHLYFLARAPCCLFLLSLSSPSSLSRLEVYHLCKKNSSFRLTPGGTVIRMSALADADGHLCGWRPAASLPRSLAGHS